jgi:hypothetical protein
LNLALGVHNKGQRISLWIAGHSLLRDQDGLLADAVFHHCPHKHARQEKSFWIWKHEAQDNGPGRWIHRDVTKLKRPLQRIGSAGFQNEIGLLLVCSVRQKTTVLQAALQSQEFGGGLGHIHINGVQLLDGGQGHGLIRRDNSAVRDI